MRIAYLCADFGIPVRGYKGASVHVREMVAALSRQGHDVRVFTPNPGVGNALAAPLYTMGAVGLPRAISHLTDTAAGRRYPRLGKEVRELVYNVTLLRRGVTHGARWRPHAIYERYSLFNLAGLALARLWDVPHLLEVNAPLRLERARTKGLVLDGLAAQVERRLFGGSGAVLTVSAALRRYAIEHGAREAHTLVLPNGVDTHRFHPRTCGQAARARWGLPPGAVVIGFAGSLKPWHGTETLLEAFAALHAAEHAMPERWTRLLIVGEGPQEELLRRRSAALGLGGVIVFTGKVTHEEMPELLAAMNIGVAPYLAVPDFYFSPLKLYEYMAAGLPVVASDAGEIATLVRHDETGLLCVPGDVRGLTAALRRLVRDPAVRTRLGAAARAEAERHTWDHNAGVVAGLCAALKHDRTFLPRELAAAQLGVRQSCCEGVFPCRGTHQIRPVEQLGGVP